MTIGAAQQFFLGASKATGGGAAGYQIERSLRFSSNDSAYLSRTPSSAGNRKTWTWAGWVKRAVVGQQALFHAGSSNQTVLWFDGNVLEWTYYTTGYNARLTTTAVYRDFSAWMHVVFVLDTTQATANNRMRLYVNGEEVTTFTNRTNPALNDEYNVNNTVAHQIGYNGVANGYYFNGYLADIHFIDGQALTPSSFTEVSATTGQLIPKAYAGTYTGNSFWLKFNDNSAATATTLGKDSFLLGNNWTPNNLSVIPVTGNGSFPTSTITGSAGLTGQSNVFDGTIITSATVSLSTDNFILFTPTTGIGYSTSVRFYAYAPNGYAITNYYSLNGGPETTFVGGGSGFNGSAWITAVTGSGTLSSLKVRLTRAGDNSSATLFAIEVDGTILTSFSAAAGNDSLVDTPTSYGTDTGAGGEVRGNYCTLNPIDFRKQTAGSFLSTVSNGNLDGLFIYGGSADNSFRGTISVPSSGKYYWEFTLTSRTTAYGPGVYIVFGIGDVANAYIYDIYAPILNVNDVVGVAANVDGSSWQVYINNVQVVNQAVTYSGGDLAPRFGMSAPIAWGFSANFGQRAFAYTAPSGFKSLCDTNLPAPLVALPNTVMDVVLYTGTGAALTPTSSLGFNPDWIWIKSRSAATDHALYDVVRGAQARLESNTTDAEVTTDGGVTAFNSAGFTLGTLAQVNTSSATYAAWCWDAGTSTASNTQGSITSTVRANVSAGFSVATFNSGSSGNKSFGHGLNVAPSLVLIKNRTSSGSWITFHRSAITSVNNFLRLETTDSIQSGTGVWGTALPDSSLVYFSSTNTVATNVDCVCYSFAPVVGYSAMGSYVGNGSATDGPFVYTGFRPKWILLKDASAGGTNWTLLDTSRDTYNVATNNLYPNLSNAENSGSNNVDILSNGFKLKTATGGGVNTNGNTVIYAAFAESPLQYSRAR